MKPVSTPNRKLHVKSRLAMGISSEHMKKSRRLSRDETDFYSNIWSGPQSAPRHITATKKPAQYIDISQVAYVLTRSGYKSEYEGHNDTVTLNIWASLDSEQNAFALKTASISKREHIENILSTPISEHSSEGGSSVVTLSSILSLGPLRMDVNPHGSVVSLNDFSSIISTPVSAPERKGDAVVFSDVLTCDDEVDMSWSSQFLLGLHEPIRHALYVIDRFLERSRALKSPMKWNVREFFYWFRRYFVEFVRNQRDIKATVLLPLVIIKVVEKHDIISLYQAAFALIEVIIGQEDDLTFSAASCVDSWHTRLSTLQDNIRRLNYLLLNALALEEEAFKPAIELAFSEKAFQRYVMPRIFRATKPKRVMVPWIVERSRVWGGIKVAQAYKEDLSFMARFLYDHVWHPYFDTNIASAMMHLDNDVRNVATKDSDEAWFGCSVM
ncbi:uncharacterized protein PHALS_00544 [Plasmopara halstedii]|uniref:Uncharacterized protein n=1 Tax=Plasmopara halstedii TaxID=4781 RepID=A0A0P1A859_PLAHL|nr:uncharacterized protein PHALS_00544 [Plasmopara halstedii]CEG36225.1 hypothetical protein PHALS_00544 [Plasmopara halstedii]|eukprot:XP_024572594.1 hypothetical protein PHALS_00544 [Plasmopara halstedii]